MKVYGEDVSVVNMLFLIYEYLDYIFGLFGMFKVGYLKEVYLI